ncbi:Uncharacterised protein [Mycobacterium tuberculosis]|uniref:Uncharacterized protein n=1 Tax=Mycobacterium tuberculosis TaxID=1773 RepID=A0A655J6V0_MYCTX|nr:Uncharacterised protein [Mycobacterium tuberculosis]COW53218.1 Uncharacterised protein [Mycobacterium tuberculosis]SGO95085.1 Uncharacterised protein [Mycobacterium tuberculosis]
MVRLSESVSASASSAGVSGATGAPSATAIAVAAPTAVGNTDSDPARDTRAS